MSAVDGRYEVGDRVVREVDVFDPKSTLMHGTVTRRYGRESGFDGVTWYDPELYEVQWDHGTIGRAFFRHGLRPEPAGTPPQEGPR